MINFNWRLPSYIGYEIAFIYQKPEADIYENV